MSTDPDVQIIYMGDEQGRGGLYNAVIPGGFERAELLLPVIGINPKAGPQFRLRDAWVESGSPGLVIHVYTRAGGGNRVDYAAAIDVLQGLDTYLRDADDSYDGTYASFWFRVPAEYTAKLAPFAVAPVDTGQRWREIMDYLGSDAPGER